MNKQLNILKGALLVSGTTIGGGMLAAPVFMSLGGFIPSLFIYFICWLFMACTGLLILEVGLKMPEDANLVSMADYTLGPWGKFLAWILYIFLFSCLTLAYVLGCGQLVVDVFQGKLSDAFGVILFLLIFSPFVYLGAKVIGRLNVYLMAGLFLCFIGFVILGFRYINPELLKRRDWFLSLKAIPVAFTAFGFQGLVPTLIRYMERDLRNTRLAILLGSFLPLIIYGIWQWLILGIIPVEGPGGLKEALQNGYTAVQPLSDHIQNTSVVLLSRFFAFFALVTSFLGVSLGLRDFLADGLGIKKTPSGKLILCSLIFIPVLIIALSSPGIFLEALDFAGGYGCALLLGFLPILMVWSLRYRMKEETLPCLPGGRVVLTLLLIFVVFEIIFETLHRFHFI